MGEHTVFLICSEHPAWQGLRCTLAQWPEVRLVGEAHTLERAHAASPRLSPDLIVSAGVVHHKPVTPLLYHLRRSCPGTRMVVLLDEWELGMLADLPVLRLVGGLLWRDVTPARFRRLLVTVLEDGFVVGSPALAERYYAGAEQEEPAGVARAGAERLRAARAGACVRRREPRPDRGR
jgi:hypothetical protein